MTGDTRLPITCKCGKTIQKRNYAQHCSSKQHLAFLINENNQLSTNDLIFNLTSYLREYDLRSNQSRIQTIIQRYESIDPYTKAKLEIDDHEIIPSNFHVDHIHEAQMLASAIKHTPGFIIPQDGNILALRPLRKTLNDISNLAITEARINRSKGQAIRYFLGHYETNTDISLLAAFIQTANGKERSIAQFAMNIIDLIKQTSPDMSESIREIRMNNGHINGAYRYEIVAEQFDTIIERMKLDWNEKIKLRNGKIYQAYR
jgi:hypothetical protein